jgi:uncharacterized phage protein (TIGR01671 family)
MREIKFRAWDRNNDVMRDWDYVRTSWTLNILNGDRNTELMQFIGLHDKNGKGQEIYEGDIVRGVVKFPQLLTMDSDENSNFEMAGIVFYDMCGFRLQCIQSMCDPNRDGMGNYFDFSGSDGDIFDNMEIIGNRFENPELLTNK